jgi:hypothetical protein
MRVFCSRFSIRSRLCKNKKRSIREIDRLDLKNKCRVDDFPQWVLTKSRNALRDERSDLNRSAPNSKSVASIPVNPRDDSSTPGLQARASQAKIHLG